MKQICDKIVLTLIKTIYINFQTAHIYLVFLKNGLITNNKKEACNYEKGIKKFFLVALPLSMMAMNITSVFADDEFPVDDLENYLEVQSGGEAKRNENKEIISTFDENNIIQTRGGWG